jgi:hypothetical protein
MKVNAVKEVMASIDIDCSVLITEFDENVEKNEIE